MIRCYCVCSSKSSNNSRSSNGSSRPSSGVVVGSSRRSNTGDMRCTATCTNCDRMCVDPCADFIVSAAAAGRCGRPGPRGFIIVGASVSLIKRQGGRMRALGLLYCWRLAVLFQPLKGSFNESRPLPTDADRIARFL